MKPDTSQVAAAPVNAKSGDDSLTAAELENIIKIALGPTRALTPIQRTLIATKAIELAAHDHGDQRPQECPPLALWSP